MKRILLQNNTVRVGSQELLVVDLTVPVHIRLLDNLLHLLLTQLLPQAGHHLSEHRLMLYVKT